MKSSKKIQKIIILFLLVFSVTANITGIQNTANAATVKLNYKKLTLKQGQSKKLKVTGTKNKIKWKSSNNKIAKINSKGKVTANKKGSCIIYAKVLNKTLKCKVKVKANSSRNTYSTSDSSIEPQSNENSVTDYNKPDTTIDTKNETTADAKSKISYILQDTGSGVVVLFQNNNTFTVSIEAKMAFYKSGSMIDTASDYDYALQPGNTCALFFKSYSQNAIYDNFQLTFSAQKSYHTICGANNITVNPTISPETQKVNAEIINNYTNSLEFIKVAIVYYDQSGKAINYDYHYANCKNAGTKDYISFDFPYDSEYNTITPAYYKIYVNSAYQ